MDVSKNQRVAELITDVLPQTGRETMNRDGFQTGDPVTVRFFEAFAALVADGRTTASGFCEGAGIDRPNFLKQRREPGRNRTPGKNEPVTPRGGTGPVQIGCVSKVGLMLQR